MGNGERKSWLFHQRYNLTLYFQAYFFTALAVGPVESSDASRLHWWNARLWNITFPVVWVNRLWCNSWVLHLVQQPSHFLLRPVRRILSGYNVAFLPLEWAQRVTWSHYKDEPENAALPSRGSSKRLASSAGPPPKAQAHLATSPIPQIRYLAHSASHAQGRSTRMDEVRT
ncbi:uncharacterized protein EV420DRAFT_1508481 [Desarmillaria tabescens]|uniref:Uncharacterized protein n=1 Tax=Armillaria tabescens TaxID=1929756 RepID=A0AA39NHT5_ARMTA|nr:uncharacterized protein EV420DRAFT_1508481 [Desarmillaria tabescens]KAK0465887.1 hypothetical protein EV420DRAFT_1508481 [Desarmillaria tabescens]